MAVITGLHVIHAVGGAITPALTPAMSGYAVDYWPPHAIGAAVARVGSARSKLPVPAHARAITGILATSYQQDYYNRVHVRPTSMALGNLVTSQYRSVTVWNAWLDKRLQLQSINALNAAGITITGPGSLPMDFATLQERTWAVAVGTDGPPVINATLQWVFVGMDPLSATITGNRLIAWTMAPDWGTDLSETLSWLIDVQQSVNGTQVRQPCRGAPRREWEFTVIAEGNERQIMESALYDWSTRTWALPIWTDVTWLTGDLPAGSQSIAIDTTNHDYVTDGLVIIWASTNGYELVEVQALAAGLITLKHPTAKRWGKGSRVMPCRTAMLTDFPTISRKTDRLAQSQVRFMAAEECDWPAVAPAKTYLGLPVLETRTNEPQDIASVYGRQVVRIDNDVGAITLDDISGLTWSTQPFYWLLNGRQDRGAHRSLLYWLQGRGAALWIPSWTDDVTLAAPVSEIGVTLTVVWCGIARFLHMRAGRRHLRIELVDGTVFYRRVTDASEVDEQTEQLVIDSALGKAVTASRVRQISWMMLATLNSDKVTISHVHESVGQATVAASFVGVPQEEP